MKSDLLAATAIAIAVAASPTPSWAEPSLEASLPAAPEDTLRSAEIDTLKSWYLACDRASREALLAPRVAQSCSIAAEALMQRAFGGDFGRLIAWWRSARDEAVAQAAR